MTSAWRPVALSELLTQRQPDIPVVPTETYSFAGVYSFGRGMFRGQEKTGSEFSYRRLSRVRAGDFVYPKLMAWEGAFGIVPPECDGCVVSPEFPVFSVRTERILPAFLWAYIRRRPAWESLSGSSAGTNVRRRRLHPRVLLRHEILLPSVAEQERIVARIAELESSLGRAKALRSGALRQLAATEDAACSDVFTTDVDGTVSDYATVQSGYAFKSEWFSEEGIRLVRNANIAHGSIDWSETVRIPGNRKQEFDRFELEVGDVLVSLDRPLISTGVKAVRVRECDVPSLLLQRVGRFVFKGDVVDRDYFFAWLRSSRFREAIVPGRSNGVPHISPKDIGRLPFSPPPLPEQRRIVGHLDGLRAKIDSLKNLMEETGAQLDALLPAILDSAFRGEL